jgi:NAD(P)-dependent dehydrogenase (short-subunit alcohol dehydrogenase family)
MNSVSEALGYLKPLSSDWDGLILAAGTMKPLGPFETVDFEEWAGSIEVNLIQQFRIVRELLSSRNMNASSSVLFFAGGGMNSSPENVSAYTVSKIAGTKLIELLAAEIRDVRFFSVGPGWVNTKIHSEMFEAGSKAGVQFHRTEERFASGDFVSMKEVVECCEWLIFSQSSSLSGRNFSVANDPWGEAKLIEELGEDSSKYKLRRSGNS